MVEIINKDIFNGIAGKRSGKPKGVVIHNDAGSKNATAKWYMTTFLPDRVKAKQSNLGFAHYYIDRNTIGRCENTNNKAWHVGQSDGNANYIGFEVCQSIGESEANFRLNEEMTFRQVAEDLQFYGLPANRDTVKLHKQFSSTSCPHRSVALHGDNTKVQDYFIARVKHYMSLGKTVAEMLKKDNQTVVSKPVAKPTAKPTPKPVANKPQPTGNTVVKAIQKTVGVKEDGWDGPNTRKGVVKLFQRYFGANADGYVGNETLNKSKVIRSGDKGWHVYAVQAMLYLKGYTSVGTPDQIAGPKFVQAVKNFQKDNGLAVDGTPGKQTYAKLLKL